MRAWTLEQVWQLAPDGSSASSARGLASAGKWQSLGRAGPAIWGLCQGSGKDPYRAAFDCDAAAYKCSCPSRKQPCKHSLALLALQVQAPASFTEAAPPDWVADWAGKRAEKAARAAAGPAEKAPPDPAQALKRADARRDKMRDGLAELRLWLQDLARQGLASRKGGLPKELEGRARRMVDAQCPGAAATLQEIAANLAAPDAEDRALGALAGLDLLCAAFERLDQLPEGLQADVRVALGWPLAQEQVLAQPGWNGDWLVLGVIQDEADERVRGERVWLREEGSGRIVLLLQYAFGTQAFPRVLPTNSRWRGELCPYPSAWPLRVAVKDLQPLPAQNIPLAPQPDWEAAMGEAATAFAANPFLVQVPLMLRGKLWPDAQGWWLVDCQQRAHPVIPSNGLWPWLSRSGGEEAVWFGEWDGRRLQILTQYAALREVSA